MTEFDDQQWPESADLDESADSLEASGGDGVAEEPAIDEAEIDAALDAVAAGESDTAFRRAAAKVRQLPRSPGVYLMKDSVARVIYVGKAKNLRSRAGSYFLKGALAER